MRHIDHYRKQFTFRFANGAAGDGLVKSFPLPFTGEILHIKQVNSVSTTPRTAQLTIEDQFGNVLLDGTALANNVTTQLEYGVTTRRIVAGGDTLKCTIAGDPGASGMKVDAIFEIFGRDG